MVHFSRFYFRVNINFVISVAIAVLDLPCAQRVNKRL